MPLPTESAGSLNLAHQHAANAEDYIAQGLLLRAAEEHRKAAEAFAACINESNDEPAKRTLRMLQHEHEKECKELERKIAQLREDGIDPAMPQKPKPTVRSPTGRSPVPATVTGAPTSPSPPPNGRGRMMDSAVDESFMVLGARSQVEPGDAFNRFWRAMEGLEDRLSQPVAFATVPLEYSDAKAAASVSSSSDTDLDDLSSKYGKGKSVVKNRPQPGISQFPPPRMKSYSVDLKNELDEVLADDDDDLAESFFLIPSSGEARTLRPNPLQKENDALKAEVETLRKRIADQDRALRARMDVDRELRDSIVVAKREAQRVIASSVMLPPRPTGMPDIGALNLNIPTIPVAPPAPPPPAGRDGREREANLMRRVRELEEEARTLRADNEKQKAIIAKFREKWDKLKESSKKKKSARAAAEADARTGGVRERIEEEPEEEERAVRAEEREAAAGTDQMV